MSREIKTRISELSIDPERGVPDGQMLVSVLVPASEAAVLYLRTPVTLTLPEAAL